MSNLVARLREAAGEIDVCPKDYDAPTCNPNDELLLEAADEIERLKRKVELLTRERDAAVADLTHYTKNYYVQSEKLSTPCDSCKYGSNAHNVEICASCDVDINTQDSNWEWRGADTT